MKLQTNQKSSTIWQGKSTCRETSDDTAIIESLRHKNMYYETLYAMYKDVTVLSLRTKWLINGDWTINNLVDGKVSFHDIAVPSSIFLRNMIKEITTTLTTKHSVHAIVWYVDCNANYDGKLHLVYICMNHNEELVKNVLNTTVAKVSSKEQQ
jgi:hypothetical protein